MSVATNSRRNGHDTTHRGIGLDEAVCPLCEQPVESHDRLIELRVIEQERFAEIETRVRVQVTNERDAEIARVQQQGLAAVDAAQRAAAKRETVIRREVQATVTAALAPKLAEATAAKKLADQQMKELRAGFETVLREKLDAQVEAAAKARGEAVNAVTEKFFGENLRLQERVLELQRMLEKKQPQERGDIFETDIAEALMAAFPQDQIACERVKKGQNGADIAVRVFSPSGTCIGTVLVECKSVKRFSNGWIAKLKEDAIQMGAAYSVLTTAAFPQGENQLAVRDGVIVAHPGRIVAVVGILRRAILTFHMLKLTNEQREAKADQLLDYLTSDKVADRWERIGQATTELRAIETADASWQEKTRSKRLAQVRSIEASRDELHGDISCFLQGEPEDLL